MAGWTKAQFDAAYEGRPERYMGEDYNRQRFIDGQTSVKIHYHRYLMAPILSQRWTVLAPILNIALIDSVCIAGAGFGWGVEAFIAATGVTNTVGIDISDYIQAEKGNAETVELRAELTAAGLDPDSVRGQQLLLVIDNGQPRSSVIILQEDMSTNASRQAIRAALGNTNPSVIIYEDLFDDNWTDQELIDARNAGNGFGGQQRLICVYTETAARSAQQLHDLMPASPSFEVITTNGQTYIP